jgi:hypothetical protein
VGEKNGLTEEEIQALGETLPEASAAGKAPAKGGKGASKKQASKKEVSKKEVSGGGAKAGKGKGAAEKAAQARMTLEREPSTEPEVAT